MGVNLNLETLPVGYVHLFGINELVPENDWMLLEGQSLDIDIYPQLFEKLGYSFGGEKGSFKLPDYRLKASSDPLFSQLSDSGWVTDKYAIKVK